jgi:putative addiction module CopG family antidote
MSHQFPPDVQQMIGDHMASGKYQSENDLLRNALRALKEKDEDLEAVREALAEWRSGDSGIPVKEAFAGLRSQYQLGENANPLVHPINFSTNRAQ